MNSLNATSLTIIDHFVTAKYFGSSNMTGNYWTYQRASVDPDKMRYLGSNVKLMIVHGMLDQANMIKFKDLS